MENVANGNLLAGSLSPYLAQHKDNPVHWRPWGPDALDEARRRNKPILLSIGYAACHWCHVMAHESFEDPETAALMNSLYVNIKVDREERPDLDQIYMTALHALGQPGGWPLTMFLAPDGKAFWGGTYFPKEASQGRPSFKDVLTGISDAFHKEAGKIKRNEQAIFAAVTNELATPSARDTATTAKEALMYFGAESSRYLDSTHGGIGTAPKFPNAPLWESLWRYGLRTKDQAARDAALFWLQSLCQGGIFDHVGGGLARYSVDQQWLVPHFEKMLYDNALFLRCLSLAEARNPQPLFHRRIEETVAFLQRDMRSDSGGLISSLDADSDGEEGKFYIWSNDEVDAVLGPDSAFFRALYDVSSSGNWDGHVILNRLKQRGEFPEDEEIRARKCLDRLMEARKKRTSPGRDEKVLTDWNGLAIRAIADAAFVLRRSVWMDFSEEVYQAVFRSRSKDGRLCHASRGGRMTFPCLLSDLAAMMNAAISLHGLTGKAKYLADAESLLDEAEAWFSDSHGSYYYTASDAEDIPLRTYHDFDEATPSASGQMAEAIARLASISGRPGLAKKAETANLSLWSRIANRLEPAASAINAADTLEKMQKLEVPAANHSLIAVAVRSLDPARQVVLVNPAQQNMEAAVLCRGMYCLPPIHDLDVLAYELAEAESG